MDVEYLMPETTAREIFEKRIAPEQLPGEPQANPLLLVVGGQPGAGKSTTEANLARWNGRDGMSTVDADRYRPYHDNYDRWMAEDDVTASEKTDPDASRWTGWAQDHAIQNRYDVVYSTTLSSGQAAEDTITKFRAAGYRVEVAAVATPEAQSRLGVIQRYTDQRDRTGSGRYVPPNVQTHAYAGLPGALEHVERRGLADAVHVYDRAGHQLYTNRRDADGRWAEPPGAGRALEAGRNRGWTEREARGLPVHGRRPGRPASHRAGPAGPDAPGSGAAPEPAPARSRPRCRRRAAGRTSRV